MNRFLTKRNIIILVGVVIVGIFAFEAISSWNRKNALNVLDQTSELQTNEFVVDSVNPLSALSYPIDDFSCQPNECEAEIGTGINGVAYPVCNPLVQINNTGAKNALACDYWRNQERYFGEEDYVDLSQMSAARKLSNDEKIVDGFLGMDAEIQVHRNAATVFLDAEEKFNKLYGSTRQGSTYFLPSYPDGYKFEFSGSLVKRAVRGSSENKDGYLYEGEYITPSNHFWGAAIDFNSPDNFGNRFGAKCSINIPPELVTVFESSGLRWGGRFFSDSEDVKFFDPMHFEVVPDCVDDDSLDLNM